jgi:chemotaxis response regulator CheB
MPPAQAPVSAADAQFDMASSQQLAWTRQARAAVREARTGDLLDPDSIHVAPGGSHLRISDDRRLRFAEDGPEGGLRPRADFMIADAARPLYQLAA